MKSTKQDANASPECATFVGSPAIDHTIIGLCPEATELSGEQIQYIGKLIHTYIIGGEEAIDIIDIIEEIMNKNVAEFIEEIGMIAREEEIDTIEEMEAHIRRLEGTFNTSIVCAPSEIPGEETAELAIAISSEQAINVPTN